MADLNTWKFNKMKELEDKAESIRAKGIEESLKAQAVFIEESIKATDESETIKGWW